MSDFKTNTKLHIILAALAAVMGYTLHTAGQFTQTEEGLELVKSFNEGTLQPILISGLWDFAIVAAIYAVLVWMNFLPDLDGLAKKVDEQLGRNKEPEPGKATPAKEPAVKSNNHLLLIALAAGLLWWGGFFDRFMPDGVKPVGKPQAVLFLVDEGVSDQQNVITVSGLIDAKLQDANIERRRMSIGAEEGTAEDWVGGAIDSAGGQASMVLWYGGENFKVHPIPDSEEKLDATLRIR